MAYGDLSRRKPFDKVFCDIVINIAKNPKYDEYRCKPDSMVYLNLT